MGQRVFNSDQEMVRTITVGFSGNDYLLVAFGTACCWLIPYRFTAFVDHSLITKLETSISTMAMPERTGTVQQSDVIAGQIILTKTK